MSVASNRSHRTPLPRRSALAPPADRAWPAPTQPMAGGGCHNPPDQGRPMLRPHGWHRATAWRSARRRAVPFKWQRQSVRCSVYVAAPIHDLLEDVGCGSPTPCCLYLVGVDRSLHARCGDDVLASSGRWKRLELPRGHAITQQIQSYRLKCRDQFLDQPVSSAVAIVAHCLERQFNERFWIDRCRLSQRAELV